MLYQSSDYSKDINRIPIPDRTLIPGSHGGDIFAEGRNYKGEGHENLITTRGCHFKCAFCSSKALGGATVKYRSIENIRQELKYIAELGDTRQLRICDENIAANKPRFLELCKTIKEYGFIWRCSVRAERLSFDVCEAMYKGGCREVSVGIESGDQTVLNYLNKKTSTEKMREGCSNAYANNIAVRALFMIGTPGEKENTPEINHKYISSLAYDIIVLSTFIPLPGTNVWDDPDKYNCEILSKDYAKYNKDYYHSDGVRTYEPLIWNKFLTLDQQIDNVRRMEEYITLTGKYNKG